MGMEVLVADNRDATRKLRAVNPHDDPAAPSPTTASLGQSLVRLMGGPQSRRRLALGRVALGTLLAVAVILLGASGGRHLLRKAHAWLAERPGYRTRFDTIQLDPQPPPWIRSGSEGLLQRVASRSQYGETLSSLNLVPADLARDFMRESPWVQAVRCVRVQARNQIVVSLTYREPVAALALGSNRRIVLDRHAVVLPSEDLELSGQRPLPLLRGVVPERATAIPLPGQRLVVEPPPDQPPDDPSWATAYNPERLLQAVRLAGVWRDWTQGGNQTESALVPTAIHATSSGLFVEIRGSMIRWSPLPDELHPGDPDDEARWHLLKQWLEQERLDTIRYPFRGYLDFDGDHAVVRTY